MKLEVTKAQLEAIKSLTDDCAGMIGGGCEEADRIWSKHIRLIDRMLRKNGHDRYFNSQECKQEIDMTIEQLQEENEKLKKAITDIYRNCMECGLDGSGNYYAVEQDHVNDAYELVDPTE